jgi:hypothetical protein
MPVRSIAAWSACGRRRFTEILIARAAMVAATRNIAA